MLRTEKAVLAWWLCQHTTAPSALGERAVGMGDES